MLALVLAGAACLPGSAQAAFGVNDFDVTFTNEDGSSATQAGSHPFAMTTALAMNVGGEEPEGRLRELFLAEIPGLVGDTAAYPRCTAEGFSTLKDGVNDCPLETAVGISTGSFGEPGNRVTAPVFNLVPPAGALMRLGFHVGDAANVVADFELSQEPPYNVVATIGDVPEAIELFGLELQLWGDPASPAHDEFRGVCAVLGGSSCPVPARARPLLTLPTSCKGPQASFYGAISWDDDNDFGSVLTHDGADEPMGFIGCGKLAFGPQASTALTTKDAQSPTGLDLSVDTLDEGLTSVAGLAQSQIRDVVVALPEGMTAGPSLTAHSGGCSEADVEAETPESAPGDGCPASSEVGTAEVESPLLDEPIDGTVYRATPNENFADSAMALYVVLKNPDLGIVIAQPVALETDSGTGQLLAVAEEMPQLPFSHLNLRLDDGKGGPLVSPPRCGKYEAEAELDPWAGGGTFRFLSPLQISTGPNGGPCPTGAAEDHSASGLLPPGTSSPLASHRPALRKRRRCRKGKHRVRRHGKARCIAGRHRKHGVRAG